MPILPGRYLLALLLTVAIEAGVAWLFGLRTPRSQLAVAMINLMTNPLLNLLLLLLAFLGVKVTLTLVTLLEIPVALAEWGLLVYVFGGPRSRRLAISAAANAASFLAGVGIFWM